MDNHFLAFQFFGNITAIVLFGFCLLHYALFVRDGDYEKGFTHVPGKKHTRLIMRRDTFLLLILSSLFLFSYLFFTFFPPTTEFGFFFRWIRMWAILSVLNLLSYRDTTPIQITFNALVICLSSMLALDAVGLYLHKSSLFADFRSIAGFIISIFLYFFAIFQSIAMQGTAYVKHTTTVKHWTIKGYIAYIILTILWITLSYIVWM